MTVLLFSELIDEYDEYDELAPPSASAGASHTKDVSGSITPTGSVNNSVGSGAIVIDGSITPTGDLFELSVGIDDFGGVLTPNGSISLVTSGHQVFTGSGLDLGGEVSFITGFVVGGSITPTGQVTHPQSHTVVGSITPTGAITENTVGNFQHGSAEGQRHRRKKAALP